MGICNNAGVKAIGAGASMPLLCTGLKDSEALAYCTFGAACSEVELDVLTGEQRVLRCDILFDCGRSINPALDMVQLRSCLQSMYLPVVSHGANNSLFTPLTGDQDAPLQQRLDCGCSADLA